MNFLFKKYPFDFSENLFIPEVFLLSGGAGTGRDTGQHRSGIRRRVPRR